MKAIFWIEVGVCKCQLVLADFSGPQNQKIVWLLSISNKDSLVQSFRLKVKFCRNSLFSMLWFNVRIIILPIRKTNDGLASKLSVAQFQLIWIFKNPIIVQQKTKLVSCQLYGLLLDDNTASFVQFYLYLYCNWSIWTIWKLKED